MKTKLMFGLLALGIASAFACGSYEGLPAIQAVSADRAVASNAIATLRQMGPAGLDLLLRAHASLLANHAANDPQWQRLRAALDAVGGQRDCHSSGLFWHTNFNDAQAEAQRTGKPILSLRLLGRLDEELSCANSRFFRTTLYANQTVANYLRDHFVLHWKSVRPVPRITIDMGDGRKIERTITGNSIHYILDAQGGVVDALPGLYSPQAFLAGLQEAERTAAQVAKLEAAERPRALQSFHQAQFSRINARWNSDLAKVLPPEELTLKAGALSSGTKPARPSAAAAMPLTASKVDVERPLLRAFTRENLERTMTDQLWARIAALHQGDVKLDSNTVALIRAKAGPPAADAMRLAFSKSIVEDPMLRVLRNLQRSIAEDTVRNEYTFHARIHEWLATPGATATVDSLNRRVYAELFLTPDSDPWLGLAPADTFSALDQGGLVSK